MKFIVGSLGLIWLLLVVGGVAALARYEATPTQIVGTYPQHYPVAGPANGPSDRPTLLFFAHPKCPCTRASLHELARLMTDAGGRLNAYVVFMKPSDAPADWVDTDLKDIAESIPGVQTIVDEGENLGTTFNAQTSGTALLYDHKGELRFSGGITSSRGHEGDNAGRDAIFRIVTSDIAPLDQTPVFGCPLHKKDCLGENIDPAA